MYARIITNKNIGNTLSYHERKVIQGKAECILADNFMKDLGELTREDKLYHLRRLSSLNEHARQVTLHIFINFHPDDRLSNKQMGLLARDYMEKIGIPHRPYLVYRHDDAGHPHLHIVSTTIGEDGKRMRPHNLVVRDSAKVSQELEIKYSLVKWQPNQDRSREYKLNNQDRPLTYGKEGTTQAITRVLNVVLDQYNYTDLSELNILLRLYNVHAIAGQEGSVLRQKGGLYYCALNEKGKQASDPLPASALYNKPTLKNLEKAFARNQSLRPAHQLRLTTSIDHILLRQKADLPAFRASLQKEGITTILQKDKAGRPLNLWYIDQQTRCIFNGNALGSRYTMSAIQERCQQKQSLQPEQQQTQRLHPKLRL